MVSAGSIGAASLCSVLGTLTMGNYDTIENREWIRRPHPDDANGRRPRNAGGSHAAYWTHPRAPALAVLRGIRPDEHHPAAHLLLPHHGEIFQPLDSGRPQRVLLPPRGRLFHPRAAHRPAAPAQRGQAARRVE